MKKSEIVERLARGLYEREKKRDRTSNEKLATWEDLNFGRKATRLHYADELFEIVFGGLGFTWKMVDALNECIEARDAAGGRDDVAAEARSAVDIIATLLPPRVAK
jgi:hypothetical protein